MCKLASWWRYKKQMCKFQSKGVCLFIKGVCIQSYMLIGAVGGKNRNQPVIAPPWGLFEKIVVAFLPWPSRNVLAKFHGNGTLCAWVRAFSAKRTTSQALEASRSQSGRSMENLKYQFCLMAISRYCVPICIILGPKMEEYCSKMCFG